jgi:hypothetical protein
MAVAFQYVAIVMGGGAPTGRAACSGFCPDWFRDFLNSETMIFICRRLTDEVERQGKREGKRYLMVNL